MNFPRMDIARGMAAIATISALWIGCAPSRPAPEPYLFAWPFPEVEWKGPRGGETQGPAVSLDRQAGDAWNRIQSAATPFEKDRAAILAMAGDYRASFDFLETAVFRKDGKAAPARPYRTWGTERVYLAADSGGFISLQHILVQFMVDAKGKMQGPMVQKHWRQDWRYEPASIAEYRGNRLWQVRATAPEERRGAWSQSVYQVDDSPRYASTGRWEHNASFSAWAGSKIWRPLPRREYTARKDYQALFGANRHTILPTGWLHEQDNLKAVLDSAGRPDSALPYLAREAGVDRYDRIVGFDFSAGDSTWKATGPYWERVRAGWETRLAKPGSIRIAETCGKEQAFMAFFTHADSLTQPPAATREAMAADADSLIGCLISAP